jgi:hypothetical protein
MTGIAVFVNAVMPFHFPGYLRKSIAFKKRMSGPLPLV